MNAGDPLNIQLDPEETMRKEKKSEALNIRGGGDLGRAGKPFRATPGLLFTFC